MKKKNVFLYFVCVVSMIILIGCGDSTEKDHKSQETDETKEELSLDHERFATDSQETTDETNSSDILGNEDYDSENIDKSKRIVTVYYVDVSSGAVVGKSAEIYDEFDIWNALKENHILTDDCQLLGINLNKDQTMDLNFNHATAERINSMGTTGETQIIGCIVNTYLEAYNCNGIRLLEEGQSFISSHGAEFGKYSGRIEFE